eukprot:6026360-Pyramimonas_sp.AAC.1
MQPGNERLLVCSQAMRGLWSLGIDAWFAGATLPVVLGAHAAGAAYSETVKTAGKGHPHGPLHLHIFG